MSALHLLQRPASSSDVNDWTRILEGKGVAICVAEVVTEPGSAWSPWNPLGGCKADPSLQGEAGVDGGFLCCLCSCIGCLFTRLACSSGAAAESLSVLSSNPSLGPNLTELRSWELESGLSQAGAAGGTSS